MPKQTLRNNPKQNVKIVRPRSRIDWSNEIHDTMVISLGRDRILVASCQASLYADTDGIVSPIVVYINDSSQLYYQIKRYSVMTQFTIYANLP